MELNPVEKDFLDELLQQGAMPTSMTVVYTFIDENGENCWNVWYESDAPITTVIGALELAKIEIIATTPNASSLLGDDDDEGEDYE
jgi:hypothetical protein